MKGALVLSRSFDDEDFSKIELTLDQSVLVTKSFYPSLSLSRLFSDLGGAMGLWLGLGIIQLFGYAVKLSTFVNHCLKKV